MSFVAHQPEQVYRYALRLDNPERSLGDRFGFSIVLVNDASDICVQFLSNYFEQLSHRTGERVRFVFFAEMTEAEASDRRMSSTGHLSPGWYRRLILGPSWEELRPDALELVTRPKELVEQWEKSAIPDNAGAASRFAGKLGVGRHIPCLLMFKDVGATAVHVMPLSRLTDASEVYEHVCHWVDEFYRDNRDALARWNEAEDRIRALCSQVKTTVATLESWRQRTFERAKEMRELATAIGALERLKDLPYESWPPRLSSPLAGLQTPSARDRLADVDEAIQALSAFRELQRDALSTARELRNATDAIAIARIVERLIASGVLDGGERSRLEPLLGSLRDAIVAVRLIDPKEQLDHWRSAAPRWPSREEYVSCTAEWGTLHPDRQVNDEYSFLNSKLLWLSVGEQPEAGARAVLEAHAARFAAGDVDEWWKRCGQLQHLLEAYLRRVLERAPAWLAASPEIRIGNALKGPDTHDAISRERELRAAEMSAAAEQLLDHARDLKEQTLAAVAVAVPLYEARPEHLATLVDRHLPSLRAARNALEEELRGSLQTARGWWTTPIDAEQLRQVTAVLDEYDAAVASLKFPYEDDPLVIEEPTATSPVAAAAVTPAEDTRARFVSAVGAQKNGARAFDEIDALIPIGALQRALTAAVSSRRLEEVFAGGPAPREVLGRLSPGELGHLCNHLRIAVAGAANQPETVRRILGAIGADPLSGDVHAGSVRDHDVFLSYPNRHRTIIERIAHVLSELGVRPWLDAWEVAPGAEFKAAITRGLDRCRACAVFVGPEGVGPWQVRELDAAFEGAKRGLRVIPVLLGSAQREVLPVILRRFSSVHIADDTDRAAIERLGRGLHPTAAAAARN